jgi:hypothetical protein
MGSSWVNRAPVRSCSKLHMSIGYYHPWPNSCSGDRKTTHARTPPLVCRCCVWYLILNDLCSVEREVVFFPWVIIIGIINSLVFVVLAQSNQFQNQATTAPPTVDSGPDKTPWKKLTCRAYHFEYYNRHRLQQQPNPRLSVLSLLSGWVASQKNLYQNLHPGPDIPMHCNK